MMSQVTVLDVSMEGCLTLLLTGHAILRASKSRASAAAHTDVKRGYYIPLFMAWTRSTTSFLHPPRRRAVKSRVGKEEKLDQRR